jgi:hypothetical protein
MEKPHTAHANHAFVRLAPSFKSSFISLDLLLIHGSMKQDANRYGSPAADLHRWAAVFSTLPAAASARRDGLKSPKLVSSA